MNFKILGSGGMYPTPTPGCNCKICESARNGNFKDIKSMPSLYLEDIGLLIDTPEDIFTTLNKYNINDIDYLSISHRDPDHARGIRVVEGMYFDWKKEESKKTIDFIALPEVVDDINSWNGNTLDFYEKVLKVINIKRCRDVTIKNIKITLFDNFTNDSLHIANYIFEKDNKKLVYACCNSKPFRDTELYNNADILIISMVDLTKLDNPDREPYKYDPELFSIDEINEIKNKYNIKKVIITHNDCNWTNTFEVIDSHKSMLKDIEVAYDGMEIIL